MAQMSIERQMQAIGYFKGKHSKSIAMSKLTTHTLTITNIASSSSYETEELEKMGFFLVMFAAENWNGFYGLEVRINESNI